MKNLIRYCALCLLPFSLWGQSAVSHFKAEELYENVYLTWTIKQGFTCNGVDILRSIDSVNFVKIGDIVGICGSSEESIDYDFTDLFPEKNTRNFYRLSLGGLAYSDVISIRIADIPANNYLVVPNPLTTASSILFENSAYARCTLTVYAPNGRPVQELVTSSQSFELRKDDFPRGVYFFRIAYDNDKEAIVGRFAAY